MTRDLGESDWLDRRPTAGRGSRPPTRSWYDDPHGFQKTARSGNVVSRRHRTSFAAIALAARRRSERVGWATRFSSALSTERRGGIARFVPRADRRLP